MAVHEGLILILIVCISRAPLLHYIVIYLSFMNLNEIVLHYNKCPMLDIMVDYVFLVLYVRAVPICLCVAVTS